VAGGLTRAIGEALLQLVQFVWPSVAPQIGHFAEKVADVVRPDPPFTLQTPEGEVVTGILVLDRGHVLLFIGTRQSRPPVSRPVYQAPERTYPERGYPERTYDADQSLWSPRPYTR
jgi:hypothetical protein